MQHNNNPQEPPKRKTVAQAADVKVSYMEDLRKTALCCQNEPKKLVRMDG